jgi:hypothetical protein
MAGKACQSQIGPICNLQVKRGVVIMTPGTVFTAIRFLQNLQMGPIS